MISVLISGCFDCLHGGHIFLLKEARKLGDKVFVAVNNDKYAAKKGIGRPRDKQRERVNKLIETGLVDKIFLIEDSPLALILLIKPNFIVVGDDYTEETTVGAKEAKAWGGKVHIIQRISKISTSEILQKK